MLLLFVALLDEAKPLIKRYHLEKVGSIYCNDKMKLIITGMGPFNACMMVERFGSKEDIFINIGTSYCSGADQGSLFVIGKVHMDGVCEYPKFSFPIKEKIRALTTVMTAETSYETSDLVDMEGFGFFKAALSFANREEILMIKIVSDNKEKVFERNMVSSLIESNIDTIDSLIGKMTKITQPDFSSFFNTWHFTATEKNILKDLLHAKDSLNSYEKVKMLKNSKEVLSYFDKKELLFL